MTAFGVVWIAMGFAYVMLVRDWTTDRRLAIMVVACTCRRRHVRLFLWGGYRPASHGADDLAQEVVEGGHRGLAGAWWRLS